jgi:hypothetical protein
MDPIANQRDEDAERAGKAVQRRLAGRLEVGETKTTDCILRVEDGDERIFPRSVGVAPIEEANQNSEDYQDK